MPTFRSGAFRLSLSQDVDLRFFTLAGPSRHAAHVFPLFSLRLTREHRDHHRFPRTRSFFCQSPPSSPASTKPFLFPLTRQASASFRTAPCSLRCVGVLTSPARIYPILLPSSSPSSRMPDPSFCRATPSDFFSSWAVYSPALLNRSCPWQSSSDSSQPPGLDESPVLLHRLSTLSSFDLHSPIPKPALAAPAFFLHFLTRL